MNYDNERPPVASSAIIMAAIVAIIVYGALRSEALGLETLVKLTMLVPAVVLHEISHGYLANLFGDRTARNAGWLSLNPLRHVDPLGTFIVPGLLLLVTQGGTAFGWAKPVPVDVTHMSRNRAMFVGLIGPATNVALALLTAIAINLVFVEGCVIYERDSYYWMMIAPVSFGQINIVLAIYNMLPIPPLDGASVVERFLPQKYLYQYLQFRKYSIFLLLIFTFVYRDAFAILFNPAIEQWMHLLPIR